MNNTTLKNFNQDYIESLISNSIEESINLEFKSKDALKFDSNGRLTEDTKKEIAKDISAFANSDGGIIIYGILEDNNNKALELSFIDGNQVSKETIEQVINTRIQRKIEGLLIEPIRFNGNNNETVFLINIPRSNDAPHMTSDKRFYKRFNFLAIQMEEYEIRNLYNRQERTVLELLHPVIITDIQIKNAGKPSNLKVNIQFNICNKSQSIEKLYKLEVKLPKIMAMKSPLGQDFFKKIVHHFDTHILYVFPNESPVFQTELHTVTSVDLYIDKRTFNDIETNKIELKLYYSNGIKEYSFFLSEYLIMENQLITENDLVY